ncbi:hypothetical protein CPB86DRAFT_602184 [Serendipita vermifera]|nr:hypothetical protein CPB86DRAFT_602184 [Serendipita vermifera]
MQRWIHGSGFKFVNMCILHGNSGLRMSAVRCIENIYNARYHERERERAPFPSLDVFRTILQHYRFDTEFNWFSSMLLVDSLSQYEGFTNTFSDAGGSEWLVERVLRPYLVKSDRIATILERGLCYFSSLHEPAILVEMFSTVPSSSRYSIWPSPSDEKDLPQRRGAGFQGICHKDIPSLGTDINISDKLAKLLLTHNRTFTIRNLRWN